jgi:hypothetical protein
MISLLLNPGSFENVPLLLNPRMLEKLLLPLNLRMLKEMPLLLNTGTFEDVPLLLEPEKFKSVPLLVNPGDAVEPRNARGRAVLGRPHGSTAAVIAAHKLGFQPLPPRVRHL